MDNGRRIPDSEGYVDISFPDSLRTLPDTSLILNSKRKRKPPPKVQATSPPEPPPKPKKTRNNPKGKEKQNKQKVRKGHEKGN